MSSLQGVVVDEPLQGHDDRVHAIAYSPHGSFTISSPLFTQLPRKDIRRFHKVEEKSLEGTLFFTVS